MDAPTIAAFASVAVVLVAVLGLVGPVYLRLGRLEGEVKAGRERSDEQFREARERSDEQFREARERSDKRGPRSACRGSVGNQAADGCVRIPFARTGRRHYLPGAAAKRFSAAGIDQSCRTRPFPTVFHQPGAAGGRPKVTRPACSKLVRSPPACIIAAWTSRK